MLRRFGGAGTDFFSTTFQKVLIEAQEPDYYDDFKTEPLGNGAPAAIEVLYALGNSEEGELKDFYATLENSLKDEMWTMTDEQLVDILKVVCPYLIHKTLQFLGEIPLKKLSKIPVNLFNILVKDPKLMQMMPFVLRRQAAEANVQFFRAVVKDPIQLAFKGETSKDRLEGLKQLAEIIGDSEIVFRNFSNLCALYYMQSKSSRWASLYRETIMKIKEHQSGLTKFRDLFDLTSEISNCLRKKEISPASILLVRKQMEKLIQQQANFEERDYRQKVEEFNKKNGLTEGIKDKLIALWRQFKSKDTYNIFADPVTEAIAPNYFSVIKRPMDLSTIHSKIMKGNYQTVSDMSKDIQLMLSNCMVYNKNTTWADYASDLRAKWDYICKNSSGQATSSAVSNANKMGKVGSSTVSVRPDKVFGRAREAAAAAAAAKRSANKKKSKQNYDSDASGGDDSDNDDDDDDESVIAQGRKMMASKKNLAKAVDDSDADEDDEDSYVGPASRRRPERSAKKRRIVEDSSDEEGSGARYVVQGDAHADSSDEEAFQPRTPLEKKMLKLWNFVDRSDTRHIFLNRVTDDVAPNYSQVVRTPMYLTLIKSKMAKGEYTDIEQFHKDINLIFSNCIFYNGDTSDLGRFAGQMRDKYRKFVDKEENPTPRASKSGNSTTSAAATSGLAPLQIPKTNTSDGPVSSSASSSSSLKNLLSLLWKKLVDLDTFSYFLNAVTDDIAPGYSEEIEHPMYLSLMKKKIARGDYKSIEAFHEDVNLIADNCILYNGDDSDLAVTAEEFRDNYFGFFKQDANVQAQVAALQHGGSATPANANGVPLSRQVSTSGGDSTLQDMLLDVWTQVVAMDTQGIFLDKVTNKTAPNYSSIIRRPMYLLLMKEKILKGEYRRVDDFSADVKLIVDNCKKYNGPDSSFTKYAQDFGNKYLALSKTLPKTPAANTLPTPSATPTAAAVNTRNAAATATSVEMEETEESLMRRIKEAWLVLYEKDTYKLFVDPISDAIAPGYSKKIKHPMCLSDMKTKAKSKLYPHFNAFADDVRTMFNNCAIYNGKDSEVAVYGQGLLKDFEQYVAKSKPQYKKSTVVSAATQGGNAQASASSSSGPDLKTIKNCILEAIDTIRAADNLTIFEDKVTLPGYSRVVKKPMYVKLMEEKAKNMSYRNFQDFHADVILMFDNCNAFNKGNVQILQYADTVKGSYDVTKAQLMATKLASSVSNDTHTSAGASNKSNGSKVNANSSTTTAAPASTPTASKQFPPRPTEHADLVVVDSPQLQGLQERLKRETYVPISQIYATAQRVVHTRQYTVPEMRFIHKNFVDSILFPMQEYSSLVPIDSTEETMLIKTYLPQHNINKLKTLRPENAMFGANITKLNEVLTAAVDFLMKLDAPSKFFREVPTDAMAPDYSKLVKYPMAISLLREKVKHSAYRSITDFHEDVLYICKNCLDYNGMDSVVSKAAVELIVRWYVYFGFMVHFYPFLCRSSPSDASHNQTANGDVKSPGGNDSGSGGPSPHVIPKKRRTMSFDEKDESKDSHAEDKNGQHDKAGAGSPPMKKTKTEVSLPSYLTEIENMLSAAALGHKHDDANTLLPSIVTVPEDEWRKFIEKLLSKKANASSQKTNIFISKLTELMVPFLRAQDSRKLFTRPLPQAKEVDKSEFMDFATMMVKVDRNKYASMDEVISDVKRMVRNRLITERFNSQDAHNANDFSLYALGMLALMMATVELLQAIMTEKVTSLESGLVHVPRYVIKASGQPPAASQETKMADIVTDTPASVFGVLGGNAKITASPPKVRRQVSEDGEVLSDEEPEIESKQSASKEEKMDDSNEPLIVEKDTVISEDKEIVAPVAASDSKATVMCMDVDDEVKEEFVAPPPDVQHEAVAIAPSKTPVNKTNTGLFDTEAFDSDPEDSDQTNAVNAVNAVDEPMPVKSVSEPPLKPVDSVPLPIATAKKAAVNDVKSLFQTETFDSDEDEEPTQSNNNKPIAEGQSTTQLLNEPEATATTAPVMTKTSPIKTSTVTKKKKPSLGSLFQTEAFDSDEDEEDEEENVEQKATAATTTSDNGSKIRKKIRVDSSDDEDYSSKPATIAKPPPVPVVKTSSTTNTKPVGPPPAPSSTTASQPIPTVPSSANLTGAVATNGNNAALNPPQPSETLLSSRRAVEYLQHLSAALNQHVQGQREGFRTSETHITEPVVSLPGVLTVTTLRWSIILMKIAGFQTLLLPLFAKEIVSALLAAKDEKSSLLYKHQRVLFFAQLCCLGVTNDLLLYGLEGEQDDTGLVATLLREWIPLLLCSILDHNVPECDVEKLVAPYFTAVKVEPPPVTDNAAAANGAAPVKEAPAIGADKDKCVKFLIDLRTQLVTFWKEKSSSSNL